MSPQARPDVSLRVSLAVLTLLFFAWGFITSLNDILVPHLKAMFSLSYAEAALIQAAFFLAYFCFSLPAGAVVGRWGYKRSVAIGLSVAAAGALLFVPAAKVAWFPLFLLALFVLAAGITLLQVAANPYVTLLGPPQSASARLNLTQAFNSLGTTVAPAIGGLLILGNDGDASAAVIVPYLGMAAALLLLAGGFSRLHLEEPPSPEPATRRSLKEALASRPLRLAVVAIFVYVGAEVAIGSFLVSLITSTLGLEGREREAANYLSVYWGAAMVGRFVGSALLRRIPAPRLLAAVATGAIALLVTSTLTHGPVSIYAVLAVGLCNSIMFPTIFSLGVQGLGRLTSEGSSLMMMAVVGGAVMPPVMGALGDAVGLKWAYLLPVACYAYIAYFALCGATDERKSTASKNAA